MRKTAFILAAAAVAACSAAPTSPDAGADTLRPSHDGGFLGGSGNRDGGGTAGSGNVTGGTETQSTAGGGSTAADSTALGGFLGGSGN